MKNLYAGAASVALLWSGQVLAQGVPAQAGDVRDEAAPPDANEIIVTAQKRSERLVDVPISITTVSSDTLALAGQDSLLTLNKLVPGLYINQPVYYLSPTIRGVGSTLSVANESAVAIYVDGVYQSAQSSNVFDLASIAGIEVLKGPQGTLFGRNATGGAILVRTLDPSATREARVNLSYARFDEVRANGYVNIPLGDMAAFNTAASYRHSAGYIRDVRTGALTNAARSFASRSKLLLTPADNLEAIFTFAYTENDDPTASNYQSKDGRNSIMAIPGVGPLAGPLAVNRFQLSHNEFNVVRTKAEEYSARINLDTGAGTLSSITALKFDSLYTVNDADNTYLPAFRIEFRLKQRTFTQEINFSSPEGRDFNYVVGAYYYRNRRSYPDFLYNGVPFLSQDNRNESWAAYADGTYEFGDLAVIAGIRYSSENRKIANALLPNPLTPPAAQGAVTRERDEHALTPRFGLRYALGERSNLYATYSRGFKSGAFNGTSLTSLGVTPETIDAFELGYKAAGQRYTVSASAYYSKYSDIQANALIISGGVALSQTVNAAEARVYGFEIDGSYAFSDAFNVHVGAAYTNAKYEKFLNAPAYRVLGAGYETFATDASGKRMVRQPEFQANLQANYIVPIGDDTLTFTLSPSYNSRVWFDFANQLSQSPVFQLDGSIELARKDGLKLAVFGRNLTDKVYFRSLGYSTSTISASYAEPRIYGVRLSYAFK